MVDRKNRIEKKMESAKFSEIMTFKTTLSCSKNFMAIDFHLIWRSPRFLVALEVDCHLSSTLKKPSAVSEYVKYSNVKV